MENTTPTTAVSRPVPPKSLKMKVLSWLVRNPKVSLPALLICLVMSAHVLTIWSYSEGERSGYIRKYSTKGFLFKTNEGELDQRIAGGGMYHEQDIFEFTALPTATDDLQKAERSGKRVTLHYRQRLFHVAWRGDTIFFVDRVDFEPDATK